MKKILILKTRLRQYHWGLYIFRSFVHTRLAAVVLMIILTVMVIPVVIMKVVMIVIIATTVIPY